MWDLYGRLMEPFASQVPTMYAVGDRDFEFDGSNFNAWLRRYIHNEQQAPGVSTCSASRFALRTLVISQRTILTLSGKFDIYKCVLICCRQGCGLLQ